jgi:hypothetical protein
MRGVWQCCTVHESMVHESMVHESMVHESMVHAWSVAVLYSA